MLRHKRERKVAFKQSPRSGRFGYENRTDGGLQRRRIKTENTENTEIMVIIRRYRTT
ncbi:MAG: hypothetical protein GX097_07770 [Methanomicrobiales archaeon]|nr:hypothetical protein [Methanomicrobiales archaeon]